MNARLKVLHEKANVKTVKLLPSTVIGRSTECDLKIASSEVSRVHCRITVNDDAVYVEDLGSANGTFVNGQLLSPRQPMTVQPGAKLSIGPAEFIVDYIAPTSNTVVVRRSDKTGRAVPKATIEGQAVAKGLIFSSMVPETVDEACAEEALVVDPADKITALEQEALLAPPVVEKSKPAGEPAGSGSSVISEVPKSDVKENIPKVEVPVIDRPKFETPRQVPAAASVSQPVVKVAAVVEKPADEVSRSMEPGAKAAAAPHVAAAPPAVVAKVVSVAAPVPKAVPIAKSVPVQPQPSTAGPKQEFAKSVQEPAPQVVHPVVVCTPAAISQSVAVSELPTEPAIPTEPGIAQTPSQFGFPEPAVETTESSSLSCGDEPVSQFNFGATAAPQRISKSAAKDAKAGGLKSLLSVFSRKPGPTSAKPKSVSADAPVAEATEEPVVEQQPPTSIAEQPQFRFGIVEPEAQAPAAASSEPLAADDDFEKFLRQF